MNIRSILWILVGLIGVAGALFNAAGYRWQGVIGNALIFLALFVALAMCYFVPSFVAMHREHHNGAAILALNALLGWSILGWIGALVWSFTHSTHASRHSETPAAPSATISWLLGIAVALVGMLIFGFGLSQFDGPRAGLHYLEQAAGAPWAPYLPGWIPLLLGVAILYVAVLFLRRAGRGARVGA